MICWTVETSQFIACIVDILCSPNRLNIVHILVINLLSSLMSHAMNIFAINAYKYI